MTPTRLIALAICIALILARVSGLHAHLAIAHDAHGRAAFEHHHDTIIVASGAEHHDDRHSAHGDIDIDMPAGTTGKLPAMPLLLALLCAAFAFVLPLPSGVAWARTYRPPARARWTHLLPPAQGPPHAS